MAWRTYTSADTPIAIDESTGWTAISTITITDLPGKTLTALNKMKVTVNITHTYDGDLTINLTPVIEEGDPPGMYTSLLVWGNIADEGGNNFTNTVFWTDAETSIYDAGLTAPFTGTYAPDGTNMELYLIGRPLNNEWTLGVYDEYVPSDDGILVSWSISFLVEGGGQAFWSIW